ATNFIKPIYQSVGQDNLRPSETKISDGINPMDYLQLPKYLRGEYRAKTYRQNGVSESKTPIQTEEILVLPEDSSEPVLIDPDFQPVELDSISKTLVDEVEVR